MRTVIQRVEHATVSVAAENYTSSIGQGLMALVACEEEDTMEDLEWLARKMIALRIFDDEEGVMNRSVQDIGGDIMLVSQFTLYAKTAKGNRPSYIRAAKPEISVPLHNKFVSLVEELLGKPVGKGIFGADMKVELVNDGPVTIVMDTKNKNI